MDIRVGPGVSWQVTRRGVRLFRDGATELLGYPEAIVWDLVARGHSIQYITEVLVPSAALAPETAGERISAMLARLEGSGWLTTGDQDP